MNRKELVSAISDKTGLTKKDADNFLNAFVGTVVDELKRDGSVNLVGFGSFKVTQRAAREARNPATGEKINVPARKVPVFRPG
ncbi:HU family DNA-binding protein, partial [Candidatus Saccharibacteria bacterium]|nr:HU family DNA-binding protein [Candidatus Saccharibacteria bacterium]NIV71952.1 integration host factor subunit alpha [Calditrichia bacterium]NIW79500.1 integration host factor subunit alpha [Calditrichia bacterium]